MDSVSALQDVCSTPESQLERLGRFIHSVDRSLDPTSPPFSGDRLLQRVRALKHRSRVKTAERLSGKTYKPEIYAAIRDADLVEVAMGLSKAGNILALSVLLQCHRCALMPTVLEVLSALPETIKAKDLKPLLDRVVYMVHSPPEDDKEWDEVETEDTCRLLRQEGHHDLLLGTEHLARLNYGWMPPSLSQISDWVFARAIEIDARTGQLSLASELLHVARETLSGDRGSVGELDRLQLACQQMSVIIEYCSSIEDIAYGTMSSDIFSGEDTKEILPPWRVDLAAFAPKTDVCRLRTLLRCVKIDASRSYALSIQRLLHLMDSTGQSGPALLSQALHKEVEDVSRIPWVVELYSVELGQPTGIFGSRSSLDVIQSAMKMIYACADVASWDLMDHLLAEISHTMEAVEDGIDDNQRKALFDTLELIHGQIHAARLFSHHNVPVTLKSLRDCSSKEAEELLLLLVAKFVRSEGSERAWKKFVVEVHQMRDVAFSYLPRKKVDAMLCKALLSGGHTKLARTSMEGLDEREQQDLILTAAHDLLYSVNTIDDAVVQQAKSILSILPENVITQNEMTLIDAMARLKSLGVEIPPLQLHQASFQERRGIFQQALHNAMSGGITHDSMFDIDDMVGLSVALQTGLSMNNVLVMIAESAFEAGDGMLAEMATLRLEDLQAPEGHAIAERVAMNCVCDEEVRRSLLAYALRFAPAEDLSRRLMNWKAADEALYSVPNIWHWTASQTSENHVSDQRTFIEAHQRIERMLDGQMMTHKFEDATPSLGKDKPIGSGARKADTSARSSLVHDKNGVVLAFACIMNLEPAVMISWLERIWSRKSEYVPETFGSITKAAMIAAANRLLLVSGMKPDLLLSMSPHDVVVTALCRLSSEQKPLHQAHAEDSSVSQSASEEETLKAALMASLRMFVALLDEHRISGLLPGNVAANIWAEGNSSVQQQLVLAMARRAAGIAVGASPTDAFLGIKMNEKELILHDNRGEYHQEDVSQLDGENCKESDVSAGVHDEGKLWPDRAEASLASTDMLENALQLGSRCDMPAWKIRVEYFVSAWAARETTLQVLESAIRQVWTQLLKEVPEHVLEALILQVYMIHFDNNEESAVDNVQLEWFLGLCEECCAHINSSSRHDQGINHGMGACSGQIALIIANLRSCVHQLSPKDYRFNVKLFVDPFVNVLSEWMSKQEGQQSSTKKRLPGMPTTRLLAGELLEHCTEDNFRDIMKTIDSIAKDYESLRSITAISESSEYASSPYPTSSKTVVGAVFCQVLSSLALSEEMTDLQTVTLREYMTIAGPELALQLVSFACLGDEAPCELPMSRPLLSQLQSLAILDTYVSSFDIPNIMLQPPIHHDIIVSKDRLRAVIDRRASIKASQRLHCLVEDVTPAAIDSTEESIYRAINHWNSDDVDVEGVRQIARNALIVLLSSGTDLWAVIEVTKIFCSLPECLVVGSEVQSRAQNQGYEMESLVEDAVKTILQDSLQVLSGAASGTTASFSAGEAFQNVYSVIRSFDVQEEPDREDERRATEMMPDHKSRLDSQDSMLQRLRTVLFLALRDHALQHGSQQPTTDAAVAVAECNIQLLEILSSLGSSIWKNWIAPEGFDPSSFRNSQALVFNRAAATLALSSWPDAFSEAGIDAENFADVETTEVALLRLVELAKSKSLKQLEALAELLIEVFIENFPSKPLPDSLDKGFPKTSNDDIDEMKKQSPRKKSQRMLLHSLHTCWAALLDALICRDACDLAVIAAERGVRRIENSESSPEEAVVLVSEVEAIDLISSMRSQSDGLTWAVVFSDILSFPSIRTSTWESFVAQEQQQQGDDTLSWRALSIVVLSHRRLPELRHENYPLMDRILKSLTQKRGRDAFSDAMFQPGHIEALPEVPLRSLLLCSAAAAFASAGEYDIAEWIAMEHLHIHPLLRVMDHGLDVLTRLLEWGASLDARVSCHDGIDIQQPLADYIYVGSLGLERLIMAIPLQAAESLHRMRHEGLL